MHPYIHGGLIEVKRRGMVRGTEGGGGQGGGAREEEALR